MLFERGVSRICGNFEKLEDSHENLLETFQIPVLINDSMNDSREEDLLSLVSEQVHQVMHLVNLLTTLEVLDTPLRQQLLTKQKDQIFNVFVACQVAVLLWVLEAHLDLVHQGAAHGEDHGFNVGSFKNLLLGVHMNVFVMYIFKNILIFYSKSYSILN